MLYLARKQICPTNLCLCGIPWLSHSVHVVMPQRYCHNLKEFGCGEVTAEPRMADWIVDQQSAVDLAAMSRN